MPREGKKDHARLQNKIAAQRPNETERTMGKRELEGWKADRIGNVLQFSFTPTPSPIVDTNKVSI